MTVHAGTIIAVERFGHEGRCLSVLVSRVLDDVLEDLQVVGRSQKRRITKIDFALPGSGYFMMMAFDRDAAFCQYQRNLGTQITERVRGRDRHVTLLRPDAKAEVGAVKLISGAATVPMSFVGVNRIAGGVLIVMKLNGVKNEKFRFRSEISSIGKTGRLQIAFGSQRHPPRIVGITLSCNRIDCIGD